jgi:hypothetical protein
VLVEDLVAASRIFADQGVLDGDGHGSVRHDRDPHRYLRRARLRHQAGGGRIDRRRAAPTD